MYKNLLLITCLAVFHFSAYSQTQVADKIVGVVGKKIILLSEINEQLADEKRFNPDLDASTSKCNIMYTLLAQQLLVEQAERDSVIVTNEEIEGILEQRIRYWTEQAGGKENLEASSGRTLYQLKEDFRPFFRDKTIAERMQETIMSHVSITPTEVTEFFNKINKDSLPMIPATVEVGQIVIEPEVDADVEKMAKERLEGIRKEIVEDGRSFATMASLYSMDIGRENGGLLEMNRNDPIEPLFKAAAYRLQPGEISPVIKTNSGYHIIQMERRLGDDAVVRHIVLVPEPTNFDIQIALKKLDSVRADLVSGKISFTAAVGKYSNDEQSKMTGGMIYDQEQNSVITVENLQDRDMIRSITEMEVGTYSQPQVFQSPFTNKRQTRILYLKNRTEPHVLNLEDDYSRIQAVAMAEKRAKYLHTWLEKQSEFYYIKIDPEYRECEEIKGWKQSEVN